MEHKYNRCHDLLTTVRRLRTDKEKDRLDFAHLESERKSHGLRNELAAAHCENSLLKDQHERFDRDHKKLMRFFDRVGCLRSRKRPCTDSMTETPDIKRKMHAHHTRQLDRVCIALAV